MTNSELEVMIRSLIDITNQMEELREELDYIRETLQDLRQRRKT